MLRYYYINKEWIVSETARRIYRGAASLSVALFLGLWAMRFLGGTPSSVLALVKPLLLAGVFGAATTMVAMEYFFFGFDNSPAWKKVFWFCVLLLPPLGPALYCFIVYSHSDAFRATTSGRGHTQP
jgi:hypothetical protein